jgi:hypothetical protein
LLEEPGLDFNNLMIFTTTPSQQEYQLIYHGFSNNLSKKEIASIAINQDKFKGLPIPVIIQQYKQLNPDRAINPSPITVQLSNKINEIPHPDSLNKSKKNLLLLDDCVNNINQSVLSSYYSRGRHNSCNCIYLSQSYFDLERTIRLNSNYLILFKMTQRNLNDVYNSVVGNIVEKNKFIQLAENTWSKKYSYIAVDKESNRIITDIFDDLQSVSSDDDDEDDTE